MESIYIHYLTYAPLIPLIMWGLYALSILWIVFVLLIHIMCSLVVSVVMQVYCYIGVISLKEFFTFEMKSYLISLYEVLPFKVKQIFSGLYDCYSFSLRPQDSKNSVLSSFNFPHATSAQKFSNGGVSRPFFFSAEQAQSFLDFRTPRYVPAHPLQLERQNENV